MQVVISTACLLAAIMVSLVSLKDLYYGDKVSGWSGLFLSLLVAGFGISIAP
jgi:hypothetical protein